MVERRGIIPSHREVLWSQKKREREGRKKGRCPPPPLSSILSPSFLSPYSSTSVYAFPLKIRLSPPTQALIIARTGIPSPCIALFPLLSCLLLSSSPPPEGQLNVNVLCLVTRLTRMVCDNESASGEEKEGGRERYQIPTTYQFLTFLLDTISVHLPYEGRRPNLPRPLTFTLPILIKSKVIVACISLKNTNRTGQLSGIKPKQALWGEPCKKFVPTHTTEDF